MEIVWLGDLACHETARVGGKAANLSRLAESYRVPPGFCLAAGVDYARLELSSATQEALETAYRLLGDRCQMRQPSVAVRSSAVDEDGDGNSFAGLHETYLNVVGAAAIVDAAARCWLSAHSERAMAYRREMGLAADDVRLAVLVQQLVPAESSLVAFSANPVTGNPDEIIVEANWGLGESIVSGVANPDTYSIRKRDLRTTSRSIGDKSKMSVPAPSGTEVMATPRELRSKPALDNNQLNEVASLVCDLERRMGWPVDVECAYAGGVLHLLQCRPVTGLRG